MAAGREYRKSVVSARERGRKLVRALREDQTCAQSQQPEK
jgi:hypothetical protein